MNLNNYYWYFQSALSSDFCDQVIQYGLNSNNTLGLTGEFSFNRKLQDNPLKTKEVKKLKTKRNSNISWLSDPWIYKEIQPYVQEANKNAGWNFEWSWSEACQFTIYNKNQHYGWHCDSWNEPYNTPNDLNYHGKIRKLSVTCSLSDPKDYKGGELEFRIDREKQSYLKCKEILPRGSIVVFPSFVYHRVKPVTKGTRYSLVVWNLGNPFK